MNLAKLKLESKQMNTNLQADILERLRVAGHMDTSSWQKLLNINGVDYSLIRQGELDLSSDSLLIISDFFSYRPDTLNEDVYPNGN